VPCGGSRISGSSGEGTARTLVYRLFLEGIIIGGTKENVSTVAKWNTLSPRICDQFTA
jgi:hypothetical protein